MRNASMKPRIIYFLRCESGGHAIEFALVAPLLIFLVMALLELGLLLFTQVAVESAVGNVARSNTIGNTGGFPDRVSYIKAELARQTSGLINGQNIIISSEVLNTGPRAYVEPELCLSVPPRLGPTCPTGTPFEDRNGNNVYDAGTLTANQGAGGELVQINVALPWSFFTPVIGRFFRSDNTVGESALYGTYIIRSNAVIKNEPF